MPARFLASPRPNSDVIELLERALISARKGHASNLAMIVTNPVNEVQVLFAGDLDQVKSTALLGGLVRASSLLASLK